MLVFSSYQSRDLLVRVVSEATVCSLSILEFVSFPNHSFFVEVSLYFMVSQLLYNLHLSPELCVYLGLGYFERLVCCAFEGVAAFLCL